MQIKTTDPKTKREIVVDVNIPGSLQKLIDLYGENVIYYAASEKIKTKALNTIRHYIKQGLSNEDIIKKMVEWSPLRRMKQTSGMRSDLSELDIEEAIAEMSEEDLNTLGDL